MKFRELPAVSAAQREMREAGRRSTPEAQIKRRGDLTAWTENCKFYFLARGGEGGRGLRPRGEVVTIGQQGGGGGERDAAGGKG